MQDNTPLQPEDTVPLKLTQAEHRLLRDEVLVLSELDDKLRLGVADGEGVVFDLTLDELDELAGDIAFAANHAESNKLQRKLDDLYTRVTDLLASHTDELAMPLDIESLVLDAVKPDGTIDVDSPSGKRLVALLVDIREPRPEYGGLSSAEVGWLTLSDWEDPEGAVRLNEELTLADLDGAERFAHARGLLQAVLDSERIKATPAGNLNRKFVDRMLDTLQWKPGFADAVRSAHKAVNERHVFPLHIARVLLQESGLLRKAKGVFTVTKKGQKLLAESRAGALYAALFRAHFQKLNLAYLDGLADEPALQTTVAYSLFMIAKHADDWITPNDLAPLALFPDVGQTLFAAILEGFTTYLFANRILQPLESFGLLERRDLSPGASRVDSWQVRKTSIFDRFLQFDVNPPIREAFQPESLDR